MAVSRLGARPALLMNCTGSKMMQRRSLLPKSASNHLTASRSCIGTFNSNETRSASHALQTDNRQNLTANCASYSLNRVHARNIAANVAVAGSGAQTQSQQQLKVSKLKAESPSTHGFEEVKEMFVEEYNSYAILYRHSRTGAEVMSLCNDDENKTFGVVFRSDI